LSWLRYITHIVEIDLESSILSASPGIYLGIVSDTNESIIVIGMEIGRVSWDLEFSENSRRPRHREIDDKKWINLLKCHEIESIPDETG
jgi:hypothetical protein